MTKLPAFWSMWQHHNGIYYRVTAIANVESTNPKYPITVVYEGMNGLTWAKPLDNFLESMKEVTDV